MIVRAVPRYDLDPCRTSALLRCCAAGTFKSIVSKSRGYQAVRSLGIGSGNVDKKLFIHLVYLVCFAIGLTAISDNRPPRSVLNWELAAPMLCNFLLL
jgi:hypothetical protein